MICSVYLEGALMRVFTRKRFFNLGFYVEEEAFDMKAVVVDDGYLVEDDARSLLEMQQGRKYGRFPPTPLHCEDLASCLHQSQSRYLLV